MGIGGIAGLATFPFGIVAGPTAEYTAKGIGEAAKGTAKLNHMLKTEAVKVYQLLFNFAAKYK